MIRIRVFNALFILYVKIVYVLLVIESFEVGLLQELASSWTLLGIDLEHEFEHG